jgi:FKBP-type peptidyl-prolyl cis-trans isomerase
MSISFKYKCLCGIAVLSLSLFGCHPAKFKTDQEKAGYAIGLQIGQNLKAQKVDVSVPAVLSGINDSFSDTKPRFTPQELQEAMQTMQLRLTKEHQESAEKNLKDGEAWLANHKTQPGVQNTGSGLQYEVITEGTGAQVKETDEVKVHYTGTLMTGEKFDSSDDHGQSAEFPVGKLIPGWTEGLKLMRVGSHYHLAIPANLGYGAQGQPGIPPNSVLLFDLEVLDAHAAGAGSSKS